MSNHRLSSVRRPADPVRVVPVPVPAVGIVARQPPAAPGPGFEPLWERLSDRLPGAVLVIDHEGGVVLENRAARQLAGLAPVLQRRAGRLWLPVARRYLDHAYLLEQLRLAAQHGAGVSPARTVSMRLPDDGAAGPVFIEARGLGPEAGASPTSNGHFWLLTLYSPTACPCPSPDALQRLLGLTRAEALLVRSLFAGRSLSAAAIALGVSRETVKTQLSCIFRKCRVKSQAQLTRLVAGGPFFSDPADGNQPGRS